MQEEPDLCLPRCFDSAFEFLDVNHRADNWFLMSSTEARSTRSRYRPALAEWSLIALVLLAVLGPFVWITTASFKQQIAIYAGQFPFTPTLSNYSDVLFSRRSDFAGNVGNSLLVAALSTVIVLAIGTLAAYSLHRFRWPTWVSAVFLGWTLGFHMIPVLTLIGPWYVAFRELGLYDTRTALVLTHVTINLPMGKSIAEVRGLIFRPTHASFIAFSSGLP